MPSGTPISRAVIRASKHTATLTPLPARVRHADIATEAVSAAPVLHGGVAIISLARPAFGSSSKAQHDE